ncbi:hypothetical protein B0I35DRAFT_225863 [Stachybotrys elegans]|uniref:Uncharacterized protein n=1 Tax=Stachybotrys elegans TaxID=80388 RepID=A0A8K0SSV8_9HYPO|nr:hypothetical protein B0I35DRAFT_225863 [Stachybotrys elegans]
MEVDNADVPQTELLLRQLAAGELIPKEDWPAVRDDMLARIDKIAHHEFPIPKLPPPPTQTLWRSEKLPFSLSSSPSSSSQEADKENKTRREAEEPPAQPLEPGALPKQLADLLSIVVTHLQGFESHPPHTIQRASELVLQPRAHYKALVAWLHALERVVQVTSSIDIFPLPPAIPDMSALANGDDPKDPAAAVSWGNSTTATLGTDEALGGALLTPIPWLTRRSPESNADTPGAQIHSESTETIDGPNGMGSIETVSVSVNGVPSTGHTRGVTQGELLRQEQRAGVVPVSQLSRTQDMHKGDRAGEAEADEEDEEDEDHDQEEESAPAHGGPEEIGVGDTGPQPTSTTFAGDGALETQGIDVEAAVGRKHDEAADEAASEKSAGEGAMEGLSLSTGTKREADQDLDPEAAKKPKPGEDAAAEPKEGEAPKADTGNDEDTDMDKATG